ncbi:DNA internalization-related competence protein ComEC/Rec2 [Beggiatoa leptomitoformis]|uniref:DNA internalization-related competence protein ComEC/Rec2 n=1 Tax=Beggiatoa leptomitoformis TaxID=288004 RepID=A0A2N9YE73_9GAMM|nr:DNA internalization-related competence protein ComEC/Rec2 [Beggiatoa leptomitoformis]ALG68854.1 DNA internalization-related competence protein ComEC/Rec2 [Beggiatoa leptomitoformis]AUI68777.1 DNA internalization-related competence protein ComEC/Rec2 [Beggiatoa leptomitoformis]
MHFATVAFLLGVLICQMLPSLPSFSTAWFILPLIVCIFYFPQLRFYCWLALGLCWAIFRAQLFFAQALPIVLEGQELIVEGFISDLPHRKQDGWQFDFTPTRLLTPDKQVITDIGRLRLSWHKTAMHLQTGQQWRFTVRLQRARGFSNPLISDYSRTLYQQGIHATGSIRPKGEQQLLSTPTHWQLNTFRESLAQQLQIATHHHPLTGILIALAIGEQQWISAEQWSVFRKTGIAHLVAISGLHIGLLAYIGFWICSHFVGMTIYGYALICQRLRYPSWGRFIHFPVVFPAAFVSLLIALSYSLLAGFSIPTQRTVVMICTLVIALLGLRQLSKGTAFSLALLVVLIYDPTAVLNSGFWLSFGAVACILVAVQGRQTPPHRIQRVIHQYGYVQFAITLGLIPLTLNFFGSFSLVSLIANTIAIPIFSFLLVPLNLFALSLIDISPTLSHFLLQLCLWGLENVWWLMEQLSALTWSSLQIASPPLWITVIALIGVGIFLLPRGFPARWVGFIWLLPLFFYPPSRPTQGSVWLTVLDVGQGLSIVIQTAQHTVLYDTGVRSYTGFNTGKIVVVPFLQAQGIQRIDTLIVSHGDSDHSGGLVDILNNLQVTQFISSAEIVRQYPQAQHCQAGQQWTYDDVQFHVLHPQADFYSQENNMSCVLKISTPQGSILLTSDIEKTAEQALLRTQAQYLPADILLAPHHGSKTSSNPNFLAQVNPRYVVFSTGYRNPYKFPHVEVVKRYQSQGITIIDTVSSGAITFHIDAEKGISPPIENKKVQKHYWQN